MKKVLIILALLLLPFISGCVDDDEVIGERVVKGGVYYVLNDRLLLFGTVEYYKLGESSPYQVLSTTDYCIPGHCNAISGDYQSAVIHKFYIYGKSADMLESMNLPGKCVRMTSKLHQKERSDEPWHIDIITECVNGAYPDVVMVEKELTRVN